MEVGLFGRHGHHVTSLAELVQYYVIVHAPIHRQRMVVLIVQGKEPK
jgi:hypothetical protein